MERVIQLLSDTGVVVAILIAISVLSVFATKRKAPRPSPMKATDEAVNQALLPGLVLFPGSLEEFQQLTGRTYRILETGVQDAGVWVSYYDQQWHVTAGEDGLTASERERFTREMPRDCDEHVEGFFADTLAQRLRRNGVVALIRAVRTEDGECAYGLAVAEARA